MKSLAAEVRSWWGDHPLVDWVIAGVALGLHVIVTAAVGSVLLIDDLAKDDRMRLYTTVASVSALLFGFATASIAFFYGSAKGDRVDLMKKVLGVQLVKAWRAVLSAPLIAVAVTVLALAVDVRQDGALWAALPVELAMLLLAARGVRLRWLFVSTLTLTALDNENPTARVGSQRITAVAQPRPRVQSSQE